MNGDFRNRFSTDAMRALIALGEHAAPATEELLKEPFDLRKIECIAAIGPGAKQAEEKLKSKIDEMNSRIAETKLLQQANRFRRTRLAAAVALWRVNGDAKPALEIFKEELAGDQRSMALSALPSFKAADDQLKQSVIKMLPDSSAITALGGMGPAAQAAVDELRAIESTADSGAATSLGHAASKSLWQITGDAKFAITVVEEILKRNDYAPVEIRVEDRQKIWEALRYLKSSDDTAVKKLLLKVEKGRFPNLRSFVRQLKEK